MTLRRIAVCVVAIALLVAMLTLLALEGREVVVLHTRNQDGTPRQTRTWIVDHENHAYVEVANPQRPFLYDLQHNAQLDLERQGTMRSYRAVLLPQPVGHELIRRLLRQRYGWADWWISWIADTSQSLAIRLDPIR